MSKVFANVLTTDRITMGQRAIATMFDNLDPSLWQEKQRRSEDELVLSFAGLNFLLVAVPSPLPAGTLDPAFKISLEAKSLQALAQRHRSHVMIACLKEPSDGAQARTISTALTLLVAAVAHNTSAVGVQWLPGNVLTRAADFVTAAGEQAARGTWPAELWMGLQFFRGMEEHLSIGTRGGSLYFGREVLVRNAARTAADTLAAMLNLLRYMLSSGSVPSAGDTLDLPPVGSARASEVKDHLVIEAIRRFGSARVQ